LATKAWTRKILSVKKEAGITIRPVTTAGRRRSVEQRRGEQLKRE
jgi:hypothetical protein